MPKPIKFIWGNAVNLRGLYSKKPMKLYYSPSGGTYWEKEGNFDIPYFKGKSRLTYTDAFVCFASINKEEVITWMHGVNSLAYIIKYCVLKTSW